MLESSIFFLYMANKIGAKCTYSQECFFQVDLSVTATGDDKCLRVHCLKSVMALFLKMQLLSTEMNHFSVNCWQFIHDMVLPSPL